MRKQPTLPEFDRGWAPGSSRALSAAAIPANVCQTNATSRFDDHRLHQLPKATLTLIAHKTLAARDPPTVLDPLPRHTKPLPPRTPTILKTVPAVSNSTNIRLPSGAKVTGES